MTKIGDARTVCGFRWTYDGEHNGCAIWRLRWPVRTAFSLKDYGPPKPARVWTPGKGDTLHPTRKDSFSGIRLVSGGPFTDAGIWTDFDTAMQEVVPYLIARLDEEVKRAEAKLTELREARARTTVAA